MAAGEDEPQTVIRHRDVGWVIHVGLIGLHEQGQLRAQRLPATQRVQRLAFGYGGEPGCRFAGHAVACPGRERLCVSVLDVLLGEIQVPCDARRRGEHEGPLATVRISDGPFDRGGAGRAHPKIGLTSTPPRRVAGESLAISSA